MNSQDDSCSLTTHFVLAYRMISNGLPPCFFAVLLAIYVYMLRSKLFFPDRIRISKIPPTKNRSRTSSSTGCVIKCSLNRGSRESILWHWWGSQPIGVEKKNFELSAGNGAWLWLILHVVLIPFHNGCGQEEGVFRCTLSPFCQSDDLY